MKNFILGGVTAIVLLFVFVDQITEGMDRLQAMADNYIDNYKKKEDLVAQSQ